MMTLHYHVDWNRFEGRAQVEFYTRPDEQTVATVTEPEDNPGPSVTNAAEFIATLLHRQGYQWHFYVERYNRRSFRSDERQQTWDLCMFAWNPRLARFDEPRWHGCTETQYRALLAGQWTPPDDWRQRCPGPDRDNGRRP